MQVTDEMIEAAMAVPVVSGRENYVRRCLTAALSALVEETTAAWPICEEDRRMLAYMAEWLTSPGTKGARLRVSHRHVKRLTELAVSALVDVPAVESEPVAWRHRLLGTQEWHVSNNTERDMKSARDFDQAFPGKLELEPLYASPVRSALAPAPAGEDGALGRIVAARKTHVDAVSTYNARRALAQSEREHGNWSIKLDAEYRAMSDAQSAFIKAAQDEADRALSRKPSDAQTVGDGSTSYAKGHDHG